MRGQKLTVIAFQVEILTLPVVQRSAALMCLGFLLGGAIVLATFVLEHRSFPQN